MTNQKDVLCLRLPRLRHQAHKELYAYKQVSTPVTHTQTLQLKKDTLSILSSINDMNLCGENPECPFWSQNVSSSGA